jgi:hypothetical protein
VSNSKFLQFRTLKKPQCSSEEADVHIRCVDLFVEFRVFWCFNFLLFQLFSLQHTPPTSTFI